ncbi:DUF1488 family protein [Bradyrhizobium sp. LMTR 3]|uniref:DUF1488 family protein n=1 Tax=unclassified Bradyrhizobium TaxID=2631580 RepID=UPI000A04C81A|nr:DUF1488 family protein [Bradyrhizobium sp. LMTR 3]
MPLTRDRIVGHDRERLAFKFTMLNGGETVECQISDAAMDELGGVRGTESIARQAQFVALRDAVEEIASDLFDKLPPVKGRVIRIFTKHIPTQPAPDNLPAGPPPASAADDHLGISS